MRRWLARLADSYAQRVAVAEQRADEELDLVMEHDRQHDQQQHAGPRGRARQGAHAVVAPQAAGVLLDELAVLRRGGSRLPLPKDRRLVAICNALQESPADTRSLSDWAGKVGASERTLARLFVRETGLGFGVWRHAWCCPSTPCRPERP